MKKRVLAIFLCLWLLVGAVPVSAGAATGQQVSAEKVTVTAGNSVTLTLRAENFQGIAALDLSVYYDADVLSVSYTTEGSLLSGNLTSVNTAVAGEVKLSTMSLNGITGSGSILSIRFATKPDCTPDTYPVTVAIGRSYDSTMQPVAVKGISGSVTVNKPVSAERFSVYIYPDHYTLQRGAVLSVRLANAEYRAFVSGEFIFTWNAEYFAFEELVMESSMVVGDAVYSVNSATPGQARVAYASDTPVSEFYLMTLKLKVIGNTDGNTAISAEVTNMYRQDLTQYLPGGYSESVTLQKTPEVTDHPDVFFETETALVGETAASVLYLEAGADLAAADFVITYDPTVLSCLGVADLSAELGGMVIVNDNYKEGTVKFSYIHQTPPAETLPLVKLLWRPLAAEHYTLQAAAVGTVNIAYEQVTLDYKEATDCIYLVQRTEPSCEADGSITYTCSCGNSLPAVVIPTEHPWDAGVYTAPTYDSDSFITYTCTSCGRTKTEKQAGTMLQPAAIVEHPRPVTADSGDTVTFHVAASNTAVSYKWEYRKIWKWFSTAMEGFDTDTLQVPATGARNGYDYRCQVTFADGTILYCEPAELTVNTHITITYHPNDQVAVLGSKGQFTAAAVGEGIKYQWQYCRPNGTKWIDTAMEGAARPTVYIETTTARDGYQYRCAITDVTGQTVYTEPATMRVLSFKTHPQETFAATGTTVTMTVETSVREGFKYEWWYSKNNGATWSTTTMEGYNTDTLHISTKGKNGYMYKCILTGSKNSKIESRPATLHVGNAVAIKTQTGNQTVTADDSAVFTVDATNVYAYQWYYSKTNGQIWAKTTAEGNQTATLTVPAKGKNGYWYRCDMKGLDGNIYSTEIAVLTVQ